MTAGRVAGLAVVFGLGLGVLGASCAPDAGPRSDSQTNWLRVCQRDEDCGGLSCLCGVCSQACSGTDACGELAGASCVASDEVAAAATCDGQPPPVQGLCLPRCEVEGCSADQYCSAGVCQPLPQSTVSVRVDPAIAHQTLTGFGATLAYVEADVTEHPRKAALYQTMFADLGLDVLRVQNRHGYDSGNLDQLSEIVAAAASSLGREPLVMLTSWSPPGTLKASGTTTCQGDFATCTLAAGSDGSFDYQAYGDYWRASLEAYAEAGVEPAYVGVQNNPEFVPPSATPGDGCRFNPSEGTDTVNVGGVPTQVRYPGLDQAVGAVFQSIADLPSPPSLVAPETSGAEVTTSYLDSLNASQLGAVGHHLYGTAPRDVDLPSLQALGELAGEGSLPLFQTEMEADGLGTALLVHHAMVAGGATMYLQSVLARPAGSAALDSGTLIGYDSDSFAPQAPYYALQHYALDTDPGWTRVEAESEDQDLLASAWLSPDGGRMTIVLVNTNADAQDVNLAVDGWNIESIRESSVSRSVFPGVERSAQLGPLALRGVVRLPAGAVITVALQK